MKNSKEKTIFDPKSAKDWNRRGLAKFDSGKIEESIKDFDKAIEIGDLTEAKSNKDHALYYLRGGDQIPMPLVNLGKTEKWVRDIESPC